MGMFVADGLGREKVFSERGIMSTQRWKLLEVGRGKFTGEVTVSNESELLREVQKHLASRGVDIEYDDPEETTGTVLVGGFRAVGKVIRLTA